MKQNTIKNLAIASGRGYLPSAPLSRAPGALAPLLTFAAGLVLAIGCGVANQNKDIDELNAAMRRMMAVSRKVTTEMAAAKDPETAAGIIRFQGNQTVAYLSEIRSIHRKYPDLTKKYRTPTPEVLKLREEYTNILAEERAEHGRLLEKYRHNPAVLAAEEEVRALLKTLR